MHTFTWLLWLGTGLLAVSLAPHPLYLVLVFLAGGLVFASHKNDSPLARSYRLFLRAGAWLCAGYVLFGVVTVGGARGATILLTLPELRLPDWLGGVALGGPISAEALAWGATRGMAIWTLLVLFGAFNALVDHYRLLRLTPRSLFHAGLAVTIAVAFVPAIIKAISEISEAQRARGHRFGGPRSWLPLVGPLLAGSLEKSMQLAEALDARGYGRTTRQGARFLWQQLGILAGLVLLSGGLFIWLYYGTGPLRTLAGLMLAGAAGCLWWSMRSLGQAVQRSSYRRERWRTGDWLVAVSCIVCGASLLSLRLTGAELVYNPFPRFVLPSFNLWAGSAILLLAVPALVAPASNRRPATNNRRQKRGSPEERAAVARRSSIVAPPSSNTTAAQHNELV
jgi:energy-coupling factor transport system permease protein